MRVAIIGGGVSGLGAAIALAGRPGVETTLYEQAPRLGGHAHTIDVDHGGRPVAVDVGFIVYNELNYPDLTALFAWAGVETIASDMSFALSCSDGGFEWSGRDKAPLGGLFAQRRNAVSPRFWRFLDEVRRFQTRARADVAAGAIGEETLADYLAGRGFGAALRDDYVAPMGAAIWSMTPGETLAFPARAFLAFFDNHRLLQWDRPVWRTVKGGSRTYVAALERRLGATLRKGVAARAVRRQGAGVVVEDAAGGVSAHDAAIFATHAPTALALLADATAAERDVLGAFRVSANRVVVHRDAALMPRRRAAWAAWNALRKDRAARPAVTYWMNRLQALPDETPLFVTLNPDRPVAPEKIFATFDVDHPLYDGAAIAAQSRLKTIQSGALRFAGAWTGYGFHEDGLRSGLAAARAFGGEAPWRR
ncbi:MAG: FAD-dependent oxidoreductase [Methylobacteriaceae bacterium]|nr:FAD-dependent oxidoreductase [Methylobacteriaceae bacterium]